MSALRISIVAAAAALAIGSGAWAKPAACDPFAKLNDQAKTLRSQGKLADAQIAVDKVLTQSKSDFRANYTAALIALDQVRGDPARAVQALKALEGTVALLAAQDSACAKAGNFYSVYNTIGVEYYNRADLANAKKYFDLAYANWDKLDPVTRSKLLDNLGLVTYRQNDFVCAAAYFQRAQKAGAKSAASHLSLAQKVLSSASDKRTCSKIK
jgi:Tfp pilus assembly protein PilF